MARNPRETYTYRLRMEIKEMRRTPAFRTSTQVLLHKSQQTFHFISFSYISFSFNFFSGAGSHASVRHQQSNKSNNFPFCTELVQPLVISSCNRQSSVRFGCVFSFCHWLSTANPQARLHGTSHDPQIIYLPKNTSATIIFNLLYILYSYVLFFFFQFELDLFGQHSTLRSAEQLT